MPRDADKLEGDAVPRDRDRDRDDKDRRSRRRRRDSDTGDVDRDRDRDRDHDRRRRRDDDASRQDGKDEGRERRSRRSDPKDGGSKDDSGGGGGGGGDGTAAASSTPSVTVEVQGGAAVSTADIADLLQPWAADVVRVRLNAAPEKEDGRQVHSVEVASREAARRISEHFESSAGRRSELNGQRVRVSDARRERRSSRKEGESDRGDRGDRSTRDSGRREDSRRERERERGGEKSSSSRRESEKERSSRSDRGGDRGGRDHRDRDRDYARREVAAPVKPKMPPPITLLAEKFPHMSVVALSSSDSMLVSIHAEDIEETDGAVSHLTAKRKHPQEKPPRRTVCLNYIKESRCRFGSSCQYIHALASAEREELLCVRRRTDDDKEDARPRPQRKQQPKFNPTEVPMLDDCDAATPTPAAAPAQQQAVVAHYETTLLVRDVDRDTAARGVRQMTEDDFKRMWSEIEGFVWAQLVREGDKVKLYRGAYGLVTFETPEDAADALAQTFGCGLNVSFYGTEEILEEVTAEQQQILALKKRK